ncbi:MAG: 6-phosphofructokinase [Anaerolineae bacterium]|nr:6-phosphofructokinase [Anaerolineae bacterium]
MKRIAVLTSGGDGPGLNAAIRAVTRQAIQQGVVVYGVAWGYQGLLSRDIKELSSRDVGGIMAHGGTFLGTARCPEFKDIQVRRTAIRHMNQLGIEGLVVIGGNGSLTGALVLEKMGFPTFGIPASIDNDVRGTDNSIGVDTTLNTILDAIDRIKDTASSHQRAFLIEVMGRDCGYLALTSGVAGGAEMILVPERQGPDMDMISETVVDAYVRGKQHCIIVIAEGWKPGTRAVAEYLESKREDLGFDVRVTVLGHVQRGGRPSVYDRILATRMGAFAVDSLIRGDSGYMVGIQGNSLQLVTLEDGVKAIRPLDLQLLELSDVMD